MPRRRIMHAPGRDTIEGMRLRHDALVALCWPSRRYGRARQETAFTDRFHSSLAEVIDSVIDFAEDRLGGRVRVHRIALVSSETLPLGVLTRYGLILTNRQLEELFFVLLPTARSPRYMDRVQFTSGQAIFELDATDDRATIFAIMARLKAEYRNPKNHLGSSTTTSRS
jgi:hypothetical protein